MKVTKKEVNLIIILLGAIIVVLTYFYGVQKLKEKTEAVEAENGQLRSEIDALSILQVKQTTYVEDTEMMKGYGELIMGMFPSMIKTEDQIMYASQLEDRVGCYFSYVGTPVTQNVEILLEAREDALAGIPDVTGSIAANSTTDPEQMLSVDGLMFGNSPSVNHFVCTYEQFKELVTAITENPDIKSIDQINLSFDNTTGSLTGAMTINYYTMYGNGRVYEEPWTGVNGHGVDCIFGAIVEEDESVTSAGSEENGEEADGAESGEDAGDTEADSEEEE